MKLNKGKLDKVTGSGKDGKFVATCTFDLKNNAKANKSAPKYFRSNISRLGIEVEGDVWTAELPNALATAEEGKTVTVTVAVGAESDAAKQGKVWLAATSESDEGVSVTKKCKLGK